MNPAGQLEERWVSTVDGLSDEAARGLYECGIRTREDLAAAMQGPVVDPTGNITDPNTGQQVAVGGANPGERAILNAQGQWTTIEQVTGTAGNQWVLDAVNEGAQQSSWQREALSVERRVQDIDGEKYPIKRGLNGLRDAIEGVPRGET
jgi:predicted RecB family nuclease